MFSSGSKWLRIDFHLHTDKDREFKYEGTKFYDDYIEKLENENIKIGVITNHNKFNIHEFKELRKRAKKKSIYLIPGVELTIKEGQNGIHTLIAFKEDNWLMNGNDDINNFLNQVFTGIENRESENTRCKEDLSGTISKLNEFNKEYFMIFAHIEQKSGFINELAGGMIESLAKTPEFRKSVYGFQKLRTHDNIKKLKDWMGYELAFVEGSDPKSIDGIGRGKHSYIKLGIFSFDAIKLALRDYDSRISDKKACINRAFIKSVEFTGGKMDGKKVNFSSELNTLIGIRGSGKSSILEILRYGLNIAAGADKKYKEGLVENTLASGGILKIELVDKYGRKYKIQRILNESLSIIDENGNDANILINTLINNPLYFGQKDLSQTEDGYEFNLLDKLLGDSLVEIKEEVTIKEIDLIDVINNWKSIEDINSKIKELEDKNSNLQHKINIFDEKGVSEKLKKQTTYETDKVYIENVGNQITIIYESLIKLINMDVLEELGKLMKHKTNYNQDKFNQLDRYMEQLNTILSVIKNENLKINDIIENINDLKKSIGDDIEGLQEEFAEIKRQIEEPNLIADDYVRYSSNIETNKNKITKLEKKETDKATNEAKIKKLIRERNELLIKEFNIYKEETDRINSSQNELVVSIQFKGNKEEFKSLLKTKFKGTGISESKYQNISKVFTDFVMIFEDIYLNDGKELKKIITDGEYIKIKEIYEQRMAELIVEKVPNQIDINYHGKPLWKHSLGQRASALILFILTQDDNDLIIIDQPEDDLDNQVIYRELISTIKKKKENIQFIFATHNANIPVLGDSEQIISTEYSEEEIMFESGSIDVPALQNKIVDIMEGGPEAFERRNNIYKIWKVN